RDRQGCRARGGGRLVPIGDRPAAAHAGRDRPGDGELAGEGTERGGVLAARATSGRIETVLAVVMTDPAGSADDFRPLERLEERAIAPDDGEEAATVLEAADHRSALGGAVAAVDDRVGLDRAPTLGELGDGGGGGGVARRIE